MAKNVTVITKIASTSHLTGAIDYVSSKKPHNSDNGQIRVRDLMTQSINCSENPKIAQKEMKHTLEMAHVPKDGVHAIKETKSFKGLNYHNMHDRYQAMLLDREMMIKEHPNCQILSELQADGNGHMLHVHNVICPRRMTDLKSITSNQMDIRYYIKPKTDKIMKEHGLRTIAYKASSKRKSFGEIYHIRNGGSWVHQIKKRLDLSRKYATNLYQYIHLADELNVHVECMKMHTVNGKRQIHYYKTKGKNPHRAIRVTSGKHKDQYMRIRKHLSYDYEFKGHKYKIRDKKLGADYSIPGLYKQTTHNLKLNTYQKLINKEKSMDITPNKSNNNSSKVAESHLKQNQYPKSVSHQQSDGIQPVMIRGKNNDRAKNDMGSIKHSFKPSSVAKTNKLLRNPKYFHLHGSLTIYPHIQTIHSTLNNGTSINIPRHIQKRTFHLAMIRLPHMPHFIPLIRYLGSKGDDDTKQVMIENLDQNIIDKNERTYNDYLDNVATVKDLNSNRRAQNKDVAMSDRDRSREILKERIDKARSMRI